MTTQGIPVGNVREVWDGPPGSYALIRAGDGEIAGLWFKLPTGTNGRIAAVGHGNGDEPEWTITEQQGIVTVDPSIEQHAVSDIPYWHGHLRSGVWEG